jgi:hypothetical protein
MHVPHLTLKRGYLISDRALAGLPATAFGPYMVPPRGHFFFFFPQIFLPRAVLRSFSLGARF